MKTYTYTLNDGDFSEWIDAHPECEKLVLQGTIIAKEHGKQILAIEESLFTQRLKAIDISDLDATEFVDCCDAVYNDDSYYEDDLNEHEHKEDWANIIAQMLTNRSYSNDFVWCGDALLTSDLRVLVFHKRTNERIVIPDTIEIIGKYVFQYFQFPKGIKIPDTLRIIDDYAFADCHDFSYSKLPYRLKHIGKYAFLNCDFNKIVIPEGIEVLSEGCFARNMGAQITIPSTVKRICSFTFENCSTEIWLPEGVETIERGAFGDIKFISISSTVKEIDERFYLDKHGIGDIPYVDVAIDNPNYYSNRGTLYKKNSDNPYLGKSFMPKQEPSLLQPRAKFIHEHEYSIEELEGIYYSVSPVNSEQTLFKVWHGKNRYDNIVDRYGNEYLNRDLVEDIKVSFDNFIIVNGHAVYSIDMKELLLDSSLLEYDITGCDKEGRIYVMKGYAMDEFYAPLFLDHPLPECWCIDVNGNPLLKHRYNGLGHFADDGWAPACMGKLWGMIDLDENVVIPYAYKNIHPFDSEGMALVEKGTKKGYIDRNGEMVIPFCYDFFYKKFDEEGCAFAEIYKGKDAGGYFVNRKGEVLGKFQPKDKYEGVWEPGFHLFFNDGKWGYCHQFAHKFSGCIYHDIRRIDDFCIEVSIDGKTYQKVTC